MTYIPEFPEIQDGIIFLRADGFYGPQEFTRWPQIYTHSLSHYAVIPQKPTNATQRFWNSVLFYNVSKSDWDAVSTLPIVNDNNWAVIEHAGGYLRADLCKSLESALEDAIRIVYSIMRRIKQSYIVLQEH